MRASTEKSNYWLPILVICAMVAVWFAFYARKTQTVAAPMPVQGVVDLQNEPLADTVLELTAAWDFYPYQLYTAADFAAGTTEAPVLRSTITDADAIAYGTHRLVLQLPANSYYTLCGYSIDYATLVYVNGVQAAQIGGVSADPAVAVPCVNYLSVPIYTGESGQVELIFQYSNYAHYEGGAQRALMISTPENIERYLIDERLPVSLLCGGLLLLAVYNLLRAAVTRKRVPLQLAFCCFLFALRDQNFYVTQCIPAQYNWYLHYRIIVLVIALTPMVVLLLVDSLYPNLVQWYVTGGFLAVTAACVLAMFYLPTQQTVLLSYLCVYSAIPYALYLFWCMGRQFWRARSIGAQDVLMLIGIAILLLAIGFENVFNRVIPEVTRGGVTPIALLVFVLIFMLVDYLQQVAQSKALLLSQQKEQVLQQVAQVKTEFLHQMAHELRTPLTVMSGYAQISGWTLEQTEGTAEVVENMRLISDEALRLSKIVERMTQIASGKEVQTELAPLSARALFENARSICAPVCLKNRNSIVIDCPEELLVLGNFELLTQVLINLIVNANKHAEDSIITLAAHAREGMVRIDVIDCGTGIVKEARLHLFERGYSTDGGNGIGLSLCKEIVELHGGKITVRNSDAHGTKMRITLRQTQA